MCRSTLEGGRDVRVRRVDRERKVARTLLLVVDDAGKAAVELPSRDGVDVLVRRGGEQRVREAESVAVDLEDVGLRSGLQRVRLVPGVSEEGQGRLRERRRDSERVACRRGQHDEPVAHELAEVLRHR